MTALPGAHDEAMAVVSEAERDMLLAAARGAALCAHAPYSHFRVGSAVLAGDRVITGANVENASYGLSICAERVALFKTATEGAPPIRAIAVACIDAGSEAGPNGLMPCGACRQVMAEFADGSLPVMIDGVGTLTLADLLPRPFTL